MDGTLFLRADYDTWELVSLPWGQSLVGCRWVFTVKYIPNGIIERYKARIVLIMPRPSLPLLRLGLCISFICFAANLG